MKKDLSNVIKKIEPGSDLDDAQYIGLLVNHVSASNNNLFTCKTEDGEEYTGRLFGIPNIINAEGKYIDSPEIYLDYVKKGKKGLLHFNTVSGIEILDSKGKLVNVFTSLGESYNYIKNRKSKNI